MAERPTTVPIYVDRERGAYELSISMDTWDRMVDSGELPRPTIRVRSRPRWRWSLVIAHLEDKPQDEDGSEVDPFLEDIRRTSEQRARDRAVRRTRRSS